MKRIISLVMALTLFAVLCMPVSAMDARSVNPQLMLSFDGTTAICQAVIISAGDAITATMVLKQGNHVVDSWTVSGTSVVQLNKECSVTKGVTYTLELTGTADGVPFSFVKTGKC